MAFIHEQNPNSQAIKAQMRAQALGQMNQGIIEGLKGWASIDADKRKRALEDLKLAMEIQDKTGKQLDLGKVVIALNPELQKKELENRREEQFKQMEQMYQGPQGQYEAIQRNQAIFGGQENPRNFQQPGVFDPMTVQGSMRDIYEQDMANQRDQMRENQAKANEYYDKEMDNVYVGKGLQELIQGAPDLKPGLGDVDKRLKMERLNKLMRENDPEYIEMQNQNKLNNQMMLKDYQAGLTRENQSRANQMKIEAELRGEKRRQGEIKKEGQRSQIKKIADENIKALKVRNALALQLEQMKDPNIDEDVKVAIGRGMLKLLNSEMGADAIGVEEAKRLGSLLEYKILNFTGPGKFMGRDMDKFISQVGFKIDSLSDNLMANEYIMDEISNGKKLSDIQERAIREQIAKRKIQNMSPEKRRQYYQYLKDKASNE